MRRGLVALVVAVLLVGCRAGAEDRDEPVTGQFDDVESTLSAIESDLDDD